MHIYVSTIKYMMQQQIKTQTESTKLKKTILTLGCGGINGISILGSIKYLEECGMLQHVTTFAGSSIGGIIATLLVISYSSAELFDLIKQLNIDKIFVIDDINILVKSFGFDKGTRWNFILNKLFQHKNIDNSITFGELYKLTNKTLYLTTTSLATGDTVYLSHHSHENLKVITGMHMTSCIPFLMKPVMHDNVLYVDGGMKISIPTTIFNDNYENVLAIRLQNKTSYGSINHFEEYIYTIFSIFYNNESQVDSRIKVVTIENIVTSIDMNISNSSKDELFANGYIQTKNQLS